MLSERERTARLDLVDEILRCETSPQVAEVTARVWERQLASAFQKRQVQVFCGHVTIPLTLYYQHSREGTMEEQKSFVLALLLEVPILKELPLGAAESAARAVLNGEVSLLNPPPLVNSDAVMLLITRAEAHYQDTGARQLALASVDELFECGLRTEEMRDGVQIEERMRRYACDDHWDRPRLIGTRFSDVIPARAFPDETWLFGSSGWTDRSGAWRPGRAELIARYRHVSRMCEDWGAQALRIPGTTPSMRR